MDRPTLGLAALGLAALGFAALALAVGCQQPSTGEDDPVDCADTASSCGGYPSATASPETTLGGPQDNAHGTNDPISGGGTAPASPTDDATPTAAAEPSAPPAPTSAPAEAAPTVPEPSNATPPTPAEPAVPTQPTSIEPEPSTPAQPTPAEPTAPPQQPEPSEPEDDLCDVGVWDGSTPEVLDLSGATFAHDPTMVEANGVFYRFWTGDDIPMATSTDLRNWSNGAAVYRNGYSDWVDAWRASNPGNTFNFPWAPDVSYFGGRFHIYSSFSAFFGRNVSCITHLSTPDPASGDWTDHGPVLCTDGSQPYNAIDADVGIDTEGTPWLSFGSFWDGIMAFELDLEGNRVGDELAHLAWAREIEAPVLFRRCGYYYLFVTWGICCPGEGRSVDELSYRVAVGRSEHIMGPYVDREGVPLLDGGGTLLVEGDGGEFAAAGHSDVIVQGETIYHFYHAYRRSNGAATLRIVELPFDEDGWPVPGGP